MRFFLSLMGLMVVVACAPKVPDSGAGVGFTDAETYKREQAAREARQQGNAVPEGQPISDEVTNEQPASDAVTAGQPASETVSEDRTISDAVSAVLAATAPAPASAASGATVASGTATTSGTAAAGETPDAAQANAARPASTHTAPPLAPEPDRALISDSQSFEAVTARETIESDAAKLREQRAQYEFAETRPVPEREGSGNVARFALSTTHAVGEKQYRRGFFGKARAKRNCEAYASGTDAEQAFLDAGGPERDTLGLDPDGDGFACSWSPDLLRSMAE